MPLLHGAHSGTMTLPDLPIAPRWMCAWSAGPLRCEKVSFHVSVLPLSVAWNAPFAAGTLTTCFGISWAAVSVADQPMPRGAPSQTAASASAAAREAPRAVRRIPPRLGERFLSRIRELEHDPPLREPIAQPGELELDDLGDLLTRERLELDDLVDPVQELGPEAVS